MKLTMLNIRVSVYTAGSMAVEYAYAGFTDTPSAVLTSSGVISQRIIGLPGGVTVTIPAVGTSTWSYTDLHGNTIVTTTSTGARQGNPVTYDPWGNLTIGSTLPTNTVGGNSFAALGGAGKLTDTTTGITVLGARAYNPAEGRFLSVDPVEGGCANAYTYVFGDPVNDSDLTGQADCETHHIVPQKLDTGGLGDKAREILLSNDVGINDVSNLVLISTAGHRTGDSRVHGTAAENQAYLQWVVSNLEAAPQDQAGIRGALAGMAAQLQAAYPCGGGGGGLDLRPVLVGVGVLVVAGVVGFLTGGVGDLAIGGLAFG